MGALGAFLGLLYVLASALAAHALSAWPQLHQDWFETATRMLGFHALALLALALHRRQRHPPPLLLNWVGLLLIAGLCLFCGSLYALALGAPRGVAHVAPAGGLMLMLGWLLWAWAWRRLR